MKAKSRFLWFAVATFATLLIVFVVMLALFWQSLAPLQQQVLATLVKANFSYIFSVGVLLLAGLGFILDWFFRFYIIPVSRLTEEVALMQSVNPNFRTRIDGSRDVTRLGRLINEGADRYQRLKNTVDEKFQMSQAEAQTEKNILAAILAEWPAGVLICNDQGQILLYNRLAKHHLGSKPGAQFSVDAPSDASQPFVGLGRSIFGIIGKRLFVHALDEIVIKLERKAAEVVTHFVLVGQRNELLRADVLPILDKDQLVTGLVMILTDITAKVSQAHGQRLQQQELMRLLRDHIAAVRCSTDLLNTYGDMTPSRKAGLITLLAEQSETLSDLVENLPDDNATDFNSRWPVTPMMASDLLIAIKRKAADMLKLDIQWESIECQTWVKVDSYVLVLATLFILHHLRTLVQIDDLVAYLEDQDRLVCLDLCYKGEPVDSDTLRKWGTFPLTLMDKSLTLTLQQVLDHHGAELWPSTRNEIAPGTACLRLYLPVSESQELYLHVRRMTILPDGPPEFYDFDLFNQPGQTPQLDNRLLTELSYTVFDTETTGLDPKGGDEIISIGAVRILNGRLLHEEFFDQLVDPQRSLPYASVKIHGIQAEMLAGQPIIDTVLPIFHQFCEETILVAHNAAFDMQMLQLKEQITGVRFINPVLDTMHLSAVVHPAHDDHTISAIANRLGVSVVGRHTALGDAITTGEIFLKLIPLLTERGIYTLADARLAAQKTYSAHLKY